MDLDPKRVPREESSYTAHSREEVYTSLKIYGFTIVDEFPLQANQTQSLDNNALNGRRVVIVPCHHKSEIIDREDLEKMVQKVFSAIAKNPVKDYSSDKYHSTIEYWPYHPMEKIERFESFPCIGMLTNEGELIHKHVKKDGTVSEISRGRLTEALYIILFPNMLIAKESIAISEKCQEKYYGIGFNM